MKVRLPLYSASLAGIMLVGSNSEALFSDPSYTGVTEEGYHCRSGYQQKKVTIHQQADNIYTLTCQVNWQKNNGQEIVLWDLQRNLDSCQKNASAVVMRLKDRGWQCESIGM